MTVLALARTVLELTGSQSPIAFIPRPVDDPTVRRPDITLARAALRWEPRVDFEKGLLSTIAWFHHESVPVPASS